jgi:hypothetical protein
LEFQPAASAVPTTLAMSSAYTFKAIKSFLDGALPHHVGNEHEAKNRGWGDAAEHHKNMKLLCQKLLDTVAQNPLAQSALEGSDYADKVIEWFKNTKSRPDPDEEERV